MKKTLQIFTHAMYTVFALLLAGCAGEESSDGRSYEVPNSGYYMETETYINNQPAGVGYMPQYMHIDEGNWKYYSKEYNHNNGFYEEMQHHINNIHGGNCSQHDRHGEYGHHGGDNINTVLSVNNDSFMLKQIDALGNTKLSTFDKISQQTYENQ